MNSPHQKKNLKIGKMYWLLGRNPSLPVYNKLLLYNQVVKSVWTYEIQLWGCARKNNVNTIQRFRNKVLKCIVDAPWYFRNSDLHRDLGGTTTSAARQRGSYPTPA